MNALSSFLQEETSVLCKERLRIAGLRVSCSPIVQELAEAVPVELFPYMYNKIGFCHDEVHNKRWQKL